MACAFLCEHLRTSAVVVHIGVSKRLSIAHCLMAQRRRPSPDHAWYAHAEAGRSHNSHTDPIWGVTFTKASLMR